MASPENRQTNICKEDIHEAKTFIVSNPINRSRFPRWMQIHNTPLKLS